MDTVNVIAVWGDSFSFPSGRGLTGRGLAGSGLLEGAQWRRTREGQETIRRLEHQPIDVLLEELHATHMAINGVLALPPGTPMASIFVEPPLEIDRGVRGYCPACRDPWKPNCDFRNCPKGNFDPAAIEQNKVERIKWCLLPKCNWIVELVRGRDGGPREADSRPPSAASSTAASGSTSSEEEALAAP